MSATHRHMIDTAVWHRSLAAGALDIALDAGSDLAIYSLISVVDAVMHEKRYLEPTVRRVRIILTELLSNVARHVPDRYARVHVALHETHLRGVALDVGDNGPGVPDDILGRYTQRMLEGEREHGLLLVSRLASSLRSEPPAQLWQMANHVGCNVVEPRPRPSALYKNKHVGLIRIEYTSPKVLWIGPEESYVYFRSATSMQRFVAAAEHGWTRVLAPYFGPLAGASHLAVEVCGYDLSTEISSFAEEVFAAVRTYFPDKIGEKRLVVLAPMAHPVLAADAAEWAQQHGLPWFDAEAAARAHLSEQTAG